MESCRVCPSPGGGLKCGACRVFGSHECGFILFAWLTTVWFAGRPPIKYGLCNIESWDWKYEFEFGMGETIPPFWIDNGFAKPPLELGHALLVFIFWPMGPRTFSTRLTSGNIFPTGAILVFWNWIIILIQFLIIF